jgi:hypothetical protein
MTAGGTESDDGCDNREASAKSDENGQASKRQPFL